MKKYKLIETRNYRRILNEVLDNWGQNESMYYQTRGTFRSDNVYDDREGGTAAGTTSVNPRR
jgi:hypothetical protein